MSVERIHRPTEEQKEFARKISSSLINIEAFLAYEQLTNAEITLSDARIHLIDEQRLATDCDTAAQGYVTSAIREEKDAEERFGAIKKLVVGKKENVHFSQATGEIEMGVGALIRAKRGEKSCSNPREKVAVFRELRSDYRVAIAELAFWIDDSAEKKEAFNLYSQIRSSQLELQYKHSMPLAVGDEEKATLQKLGDHSVAFKAEYSEIKTKIRSITEASRVIGPFGERYIIDSIENIIDPEKKVERDRRAKQQSGNWS